MEKHHVTANEWKIMELLWQGPETLMEMVTRLGKSMNWSKSTVTTMIRRMTEKELITYHTEGRTKVFRAAVSREELGNPVYPPAQREMAKHGVACGGHRAHQITRQELEEYDLIYYMDSSNARYLRRLFGDDAAKCRPLLARDVADPWYTGDFSQTWDDIQQGCRRILEENT